MKRSEFLAHLNSDQLCDLTHHCSSVSVFFIIPDQKGSGPRVIYSLQFIDHI